MSLGKYLAFTIEETLGSRHLRALARAGVSHVQLLPTYDFGTVPELPERIDEPVIPVAPADSELQQEASSLIKIIGSREYTVEVFHRASTEETRAFMLLICLWACMFGLEASFQRREAVARHADQDSYNWGYDPVR